MKADERLIEQSRAFALRTIRMHAYLTKEKRELCLSKYALRAGTAIGARLSGTVREMEVSDFKETVKSALREADETSYWLDLLLESGYLTEKAYDSICEDCRALTEALQLTLDSVQSEEQDNETDESDTSEEDFPRDPGSSTEPVELPDFTSLSY